VDVTWLPQLSQARASGAAHSSQNFALALFSCWHFGHFIAGSHHFALHIVLAPF
jgi:hypothetical protein